MKSLRDIDISFPEQLNHYKGKVREVYSFDDELLVMIASDRLSAFDVVMPRGIPFKGQVLNQLAAQFLDLTADIVPNWKMATPDPNVTIGYRCDPLKVEMVIRGYLAGHAWREYRSGKRELCGVALPDGMKENDRFPEPIITPSTKADQGAHDEDISKEDILKQGLVDPDIYENLEKITYQLFESGSDFADKQGLILVDTKYEFGLINGEIMLMDEIHTPDSSRYFYKEGYQERQSKGEKQRQLSKEFVRQWLIEHGFQGLPGQSVPEMNDQIIEFISERYIELYENITGIKFIKADYTDIEERIKGNVMDYLAKK
ncbi:MAG: phosphoribosylaminoimidazolesuccinocarboxamide synthase [Bacteroidetes bacterium]|nr:MAG: phosphoribosylaminoimidazolesuccinocarboxamide synthase [Bacteroidota bacterium]